MNFYDYAVNEQPVPLDVAWADAPLVRATGWVRILLAATRFSERGFRPGGTAGKIITQDWQLVDDASADIAAEKFNEIVGPWTLTAANNVLGIKVNGGATVPVTLGTGSISAETAAAAINANATLGPLVNAYDFMGRVMIETKLKGSTKSVQIDTAQANSAHAVMGYDGIAAVGLDDTPLIIEIFNDEGADI